MPKNLGVDTFLDPVGHFAFFRGCGVASAPGVAWLESQIVQGLMDIHVIKLGSACQTSFYYCPRLVWKMLARLVSDLIFSLLPQTSLGCVCQTTLGSACQTSPGIACHISLVSICQTSLVPHIFIISPDLSGLSV